MKNLIILTTAITRGDYHKKSIGKFYELYNDILNNFTVHHIINLDCPKKLEVTLKKEESLELFKKCERNNIMMRE